MRRWGGVLLAVAPVVLPILLIGPFLVPVPPLEGTVPPEQLADLDSLFVEVNGLQVHYRTAGQGEPTLVLLHGFGASVFSWREVIAPVAESGKVIAFDRPAFGLTERPLPGNWGSENPYIHEPQADLTMPLIDWLGVGKVVLVAPAVYAGGSLPGWLCPLLCTPQMHRLGPLLVRSISTWGKRSSAQPGITLPRSCQEF